MRTNIDIDDALMAAAMAAGGFKTKKEAVEEGLRLLRRRKVYEGLLALRGQLQWDDSDAAWASEAPSDVALVAEPAAAYGKAKSASKPVRAASQSASSAKGKKPRRGAAA